MKPLSLDKKSEFGRPPDRPSLGFTLKVKKMLWRQRGVNFFKPLQNPRRRSLEIHSNPGTLHQDQDHSGTEQYMSKQLPKRKFRSATRQSMGSFLRSFIQSLMVCSVFITNLLLKLLWHCFQLGAIKESISIPPHHTPKADFLYGMNLMQLIVYTTTTK